MNTRIATISLVFVLFFIMSSTCIAAEEKEVSVRDVLTDIWDAGTEQILDNTKVNEKDQTIRCGDYELSYNVSAFVDKANTVGQKGVSDAVKSFEVNDGNVNFNTTEFLNRTLGNSSTSDSIRKVMVLVNNQTHEETESKVVIKDNQVTKTTDLVVDNNQTTKINLPKARSQMHRR